MNTKLEDFSEEEIRHRIQEESSFCDLKGYSRKDLVPGVTKVSFQVTYNTTGHVLFGIATLGIANLIVENSKVHHIFFDNASGNCIGQTINEAESYFNDQCEISINNYDFSSAENYSKIKCSLGRSNESKFIYECLRKINEIINLVRASNFELALQHLRQYDHEISSICRNSNKHIFVTTIENCCKFKISKVDVNRISFYGELNELNDNYTQNIDEAINKLSQLRNFEKQYLYKNCLNRQIENLKLSGNGIEFLNSGNFEKAKIEFDQINSGCFDRYKEYSNLCKIAIDISNDLKNDNTINESYLLELNNYNNLKGNAKFKFKNLHKVCTILSKTASNRSDPFEYYSTIAKVYKEAIEKSRLKSINVILNEKLKTIQLKMPEICKNLKKNGEHNMKNGKYVEAANYYEKCYKLANEYDLKNKNKYNKLFKKSQHYIKAKKLWDSALTLEKNGQKDEANTTYIDAGKEIKYFEKYFDVKTDLSDKIRGNFSINEGLLRLNQPGSLVKSYKLIKKGYDSLENCNDKSIQEAQQILNIVQAQIDDELSKDEIELINIPDFREETEEICLELESLIQLLGSREPYRTGI